MTNAEESSGSSASAGKGLKTAEDVIAFWFGDEARLATDAKYAMERNGKWWGFGPPDQEFIDTQMASKELIAQAASGELVGGDWDSPRGALAKLLVLDQFPRTVYRGTAAAFAHDEQAAALAMEVISKGWDEPGTEGFGFYHQTFLYTPLMHSERIEAQELSKAKSVKMYERKVAAGKGKDRAQVEASKSHHAVIARFGRFPHRNAILGRVSTPEEEEWLVSDDVPVWAKSQVVEKSEESS